MQWSKPDQYSVYFQASDRIEKETRSSAQGNCERGVQGRGGGASLHTPPHRMSLGTQRSVAGRVPWPIATFVSHCALAMKGHRTVRPGVFPEPQQNEHRDPWEGGEVNPQFGIKAWLKLPQESAWLPTWILFKLKNKFFALKYMSWAQPADQQCLLPDSTRRAFENV